MTKEQSEAWTLFRNSGLLWYVNRTLHLIGWSIVLEIEEDDNTVSAAYPLRTTWFGFSDESNERNLKAFRTHMINNSLHLMREPDQEAND